MSHFLVLLPLLFLFLVTRLALRKPSKTPLPDRHKASLKRIDELEYELGIGPGGDRKRAEELKELADIQAVKELREKVAAERERRAVREEELAQTDPAQYWRDVAGDIWRRNGNY